MLTAIKGTYDNGQIIWDETPPIQKVTKVIVTFLEEENTLGGGLGTKRQGGSMKGEVWMADDFNAPLATDQPKTDRKGVRLGSWAGKYSLPDDFNDPLDDLADYM